MFRTIAAAAVWAFLAGCTGAVPGNQGGGPTAEEKIASATALDQQFVEAFNRGDVDAVMATFWNDPTLEVFPPGKLAEHGYDEVRAGFDEFFRSSPGATVELVEPEYHVNGDVVIGIGRMRLMTPGADGAASVTDGRYTNVEADRDGRWVYLFAHASIPAPAQAGAGSGDD